MSDGPHWGVSDAKATDPRDLAALTAEAKAKRLAQEAAVRNSATFFGAVRLALALGGPLAGALPFGSTAVEMVKIAAEMAEKETG